MKVKFIKSTNPIFEPLFGLEMDINIQLIVQMKFDSTKIKSFDFRHGIARTSIIKQITYTEISRFCYEIEIQTNNSVYVFQEGTPSDKKPLSSDDRMRVALALGLI